MKKSVVKWSALLLSLSLALTGCRARLTGDGGARETSQAEDTDGAYAETGPTDAPETAAPDGEPDPRGQTRENPRADRKEYDENADVEIAQGVARELYGEGEGPGAFAQGGPDAPAAAKLAEDAAQTASQTLAAQDAERLGVSEDAEEAPTALLYYTVLLRDRLDTLFECKRLTVYWETAEDHVTVFKTSPEHELILTAGAYDVSARLLRENLRVDDGWIGRKDPEVIVKAVDGSVLGRNVSSTTAARAVYRELLARPGFAQISAVKNKRILLLSEELLSTPYFRAAAALLVAKAAYPELFADTDAGAALELLTQEAVGASPAGVYFYDGGSDP